MSPQRPPSDWIVPPAPFAGRINLVDSDPTWPAQYEAVAARIRGAIGDTALLLEHAGSTSVPGIAAKNQIDVVLGVPDSTDEAAYVPALEAAGFEFALREAEWFEHRLFRGAGAPRRRPEAARQRTGSVRPLVRGRFQRVLR